MYLGSKRRRPGEIKKKEKKKTTEGGRKGDLKQPLGGRETNPRGRTKHEGALGKGGK